MQKLLLLVGMVLGVVAVVLVNMYLGSIESRQEGVKYLRLKPDISLEKDDEVKEGSFDVDTMPEKFSGLRKLVVPGNDEGQAWVSGRRVNRRVAAGSPLMLDDFLDSPGKRFSARIAKGSRAISIPVASATAVSFFVEPGSRVDILGTFQKLRQASVPVTVPRGDGKQTNTVMVPQLKKTLVTMTVLQSVKVLAVGRAVDRQDYIDLEERGFNTVTVEVTPRQAEVLTFALGQVQGALTLVLRNPEDAKKKPLPDMNWQQLESARAAG